MSTSDDVLMPLPSDSVKRSTTTQEISLPSSPISSNNNQNNHCWSFGSKCSNISVEFKDDVQKVSNELKNTQIIPLETIESLKESKKRFIPTPLELIEVRHSQLELKHARERQEHEQMMKDFDEHQEVIREAEKIVAKQGEPPSDDFHTILNNLKQRIETERMKREAGQELIDSIIFGEDPKDPPNEIQSLTKSELDLVDELQDIPLFDLLSIAMYSTSVNDGIVKYNLQDCDKLKIEETLKNCDKLNEIEEKVKDCVEENVKEYASFKNVKIFAQVVKQWKKYVYQCRKRNVLADTFWENHVLERYFQAWLNQTSKRIALKEEDKIKKDLIRNSRQLRKAIDFHKKMQLHVYFKKWVSFVAAQNYNKMLEKVNQSRFIKVEMFLDTLPKLKVQKQRQSHSLANVKRIYAIQQPRRSKSNNSSRRNPLSQRLQAQSELIYKQQLELKQQKVVIDELKVIGTGNHAQVEPVKGQVIVDVPNFLKRMQERTEQRKQQREAREEIRTRKIQEKELQAKEQAKQERKQIAKAAKLKKAEALLQQQKRRERLEQFMRMNLRADALRRVQLLRCGLRVFKNNRVQSLEHKQHAEKMKQLVIVAGPFSAWYRETKKENQLRMNEAMEMLNFTLHRDYFKQWKKVWQESLLNKQVAEDFCDMKCISWAWTMWNEFVEDRRFITSEKEHEMEQYCNLKLLQKMLKQWRNLPTVLKEERKKELIKNKWRQKVRDVLPDFLQEPCALENQLHGTK